MKYTNATVTGSNIAGVISALAALVSMSISSNQQNTSIIFFLIAIAFTFVQLFTIRSLLKNVWMQITDLTYIYGLYD